MRNTTSISIAGWLHTLAGLACLVLATGCGSMKAFNPQKEYPRNELQQDYRLFRNILEDAHPSLYWYNTKDSLDYFFDQGYQHIPDSMTETQFRTLLSYVISKIDCGHTSIRPSKKYARYIDSARLAQFPLGIKFWDDSAVIYSNLDQHSLLKRGTIITGINDRPMPVIRDSLFRYMVTDGLSTSHKYQTLSNLGNFGTLYRSVYGDSSSYKINYLDSTGAERAANVSLYDFRNDPEFKRYLQSLPRQTKKQRKATALYNIRSLQIDTAGSTGFMSVSTFTTGNKLRSFFRDGFKLLEREHIKNLVIDLRFNGGGNVSLSTLLTRYLVDHPFKLADSLYASRKLSKYEGHINNSLGAFFIMNFMTHKRSDGKYHFGYFERHYFSPEKKHHYNGNVYVLIGGNSFSASTLFVNAIKGQPNVKIVGEETGGGAYGNTAWFIPEATLPNTRVRFRIPRFRLVMNKDYPKNGMGIIPDIWVKPNSEAIRDGYDVKVEYVRKLISGK